MLWYSTITRRFLANKKQKKLIFLLDFPMFRRLRLLHANSNGVCITSYLEHISHYFTVKCVFLNFQVDRWPIMMPFWKRKKSYPAWNIGILFLVNQNTYINSNHSSFWNIHHTLLLLYAFSFFFLARQTANFDAMKL